jgi:hypothetical protein
MDSENKALVPVATAAKLQKRTYNGNPQNMGELVQYAQMVANSQLVPKSYRGKPEDILVAVDMGMSVGFTAGQALQSIAVIGGRAAIWGDALLALCIAHPACEDIHEDDPQTIEKNQAATCTVYRKGRQPKSWTYTVADAKRARLWGKQGPWTTDPFRMLQMRARGFACRNQFPDVLRGLSLAEEVRDIPAEPQTRAPLKVALPKAFAASVNEILDEITQASSPKQLEGPVIKAKAADLPEADKQTIREAYKAKFAEFKAVDVP